VLEEHWAEGGRSGHQQQLHCCVEWRTSVVTTRKAFFSGPSQKMIHGVSATPLKSEGNPCIITIIYERSS
jgi:hypothetical protein